MCPGQKHAQVVRRGVRLREGREGERGGAAESDGARLQCGCGWIGLGWIGPGGGACTRDGADWAGCAPRTPGLIMPHRRAAPCRAVPITCPPMLPSNPPTPLCSQQTAAATTTVAKAVGSATKTMTAMQVGAAGCGLGGGRREEKHESYLTELTNRTIYNNRTTIGGGRRGDSVHPCRSRMWTLCQPCLILPPIMLCRL